MLVKYPIKIEVSKFNDNWGIWLKLNDGGHVGCIFMTTTKELALMWAYELAKLLKVKVEVT
ncbi:hypothetical protein DRN38_05960 [Thermococci archaeon]|nr:MAG: hypothetical protein DRN38_05960 [Thermococci archaeon]